MVRPGSWRNRSPRTRKPSRKAVTRNPFRRRWTLPSEIQPILEVHCLGCHGPKKRSGGLRLDAFSYVAAGGDSAKPILGGTLETNELYARVSSHERTYRMPKNAAPLLEEEIALVRRWVEEGGRWSEARQKTSGAAKQPFYERWLAQRRPTGRALRGRVHLRAALRFTRCWPFKCCCWRSRAAKRPTASSAAGPPAERPGSVDSAAK